MLHAKKTNTVYRQLETTMFQHLIQVRLLGWRRMEEVPLSDPWVPVPTDLWGPTVHIGPVPLLSIDLLQSSEKWLQLC